MSNRGAKNAEVVSLSESNFFRVASGDFPKVPGSPIAYWIGDAGRQAYAHKQSIGSTCYGQPGLQTSDNNRFIRHWHELPFAMIGFGFSSSLEAAESTYKWFPYLKGGSFRKWYGNQEHVVNWKNNGQEIKASIDEKYPYLNGNIDYVVKDRGYYFHELLTYTKITSAKFSARSATRGFLFDVAGSSVFPATADRLPMLAFLNSSVSQLFIRAQNPTINIQSGDIDRLPFSTYLLSSKYAELSELAARCVEIAQIDWDSHELSWDFSFDPLVRSADQSIPLQSNARSLRNVQKDRVHELQNLEEHIHQILLDAYGLHSVIGAEVESEDITLFCNPHYRYGGGKSEEELEALLLADTMREFISYAVGCMFGRYSLDEPGLILANQGESVEDYLKRVPEPTFAPDVDNVIPFLDGDWFTDDVTERFKDFLRVTFGEDYYEENLRFIENALNVKNRRTYSIRDFFLNEFYDDHVRRYKKRPIYWMFSSPKGSFRALIYMHRYRPDTVSVVLNNYLREFRTKLVAQRDQLEAVSVSTGSSPAEKTRALRDLDKLVKVISELEDYEHDVLYPLAAQQVEIDLDDGVKVNYPKFGSALKKITGL